PVGDGAAGDARERVGDYGDQLRRRHLRIARQERDSWSDVVEAQRRRRRQMLGFAAADVAEPDQQVPGAGGGNAEVAELTDPETSDELVAADQPGFAEAPARPGDLRIGRVRPGDVEVVLGAPVLATDHFE